MPFLLGPLVLLITGADIEDVPFLPSLTLIDAGSSFSNWNFQELNFNDYLNPHLYGMVATVLDEKLLVCGGGKFSSNYSSEDYRSTSKCLTFDLKILTWKNMNISMKEERTFAQSMLFDNKSWLIMGGHNSHGIALDTAEYLAFNDVDFVRNVSMPFDFTMHCAKMINSSHIFTTGGYRSINSFMVVVSKG